MDKTNIDNELIEVITPVRLGAYGNGDNSILLNEYVYNLKLSESFYPALSLLEIALRNQICNAIDKFICKDWLFQELSKQSILADKEYQKLLESANKIKKAGKKITNDRLISEMTFGFWIYLLNHIDQNCRIKKAFLKQYFLIMYKKVLLQVILKLTQTVKLMFIIVRGRNNILTNAVQTEPLLNILKLAKS